VETNGSLLPTPRTANVDVQEVASTPANRAVSTGTNSRKTKRNITGSMFLFLFFYFLFFSFYFLGGAPKVPKTLN